MRHERKNEMANCPYVLYAGVSGIAVKCMNFMQNGMETRFMVWLMCQRMQGRKCRLSSFLMDLAAIIRLERNMQRLWQKKDM